MKNITSLFILTMCLACKPEQVITDLEKDDISASSNLIQGKWKVVNSTILPFEHISYCRKLYLNSVFEFKEDGTLEVYESWNGNSCSKNQTFKIYDKSLEILEWDMIFKYEIIKLNTDTLEYKTNRIPSYFWTETNLNEEDKESMLAEIEARGITVILERI